MRKYIIAFIGLFLLSACGFEPLYVQKKHDNFWYFGGRFDTTIMDNMANVKIEQIQNRFGQIIRNQLLDILTPKGAPKKAKYRLQAYIADKNVIQQALRDDITATRERVKYTVEYRMYDVATDKEIIKGNSIAFVSYDLLANPYSTTTAEKKSEEDAARIIANDIALRIGAYFHSTLSGKGNPNEF